MDTELRCILALDALKLEMQPGETALDAVLRNLTALTVSSPWSTYTDRRVFSMVGKVCDGCTESCGDLQRCPMLRARWFGGGK